MNNRLILKSQKSDMECHDVIHLPVCQENYRELKRALSLVILDLDRIVSIVSKKRADFSGKIEVAQK